MIGTSPCDRAPSRLAVLPRALALALVCLAAASAHAQEDTPSAHFQRGIELYNEGRYDASLAELDRAYALQPAFQVLYNIARVHEALGHPVESASAYDRYLREGGSRVAGNRRREVERALARQRNRIGRLEVRSVAGATVAIDGRDIGRVPLAEPIPLGAGDHSLEVRAPGHESMRRAVQIAGGVLEVVEADLRPIAMASGLGSVRIDTGHLDVEISVDGEAVGRTPLDGALRLGPGAHRIAARRAGYRPFERDVEVASGSELAITLELEPEASGSRGTLAVALPDAPYIARLDGEEVSLDQPVTVPPGRHRVELEVVDRMPWSGVVEIPESGAETVEPPLEWTLDARAAQRESASSRRLLGGILTGAGAVFLGVGLGLGIWNEGEISTTDAEVIATQRLIDECQGPTGCAPGVNETELNARAEELTSQQSTQNVLRVVSWVGAAAGLVSAAVGLVLWIGAPSDESIDRRARAAVTISPLPGGAAASAHVIF